MQSGEDKVPLTELFTEIYFLPHYCLTLIRLFILDVIIWELKIWEFLGLYLGSFLTWTNHINLFLCLSINRNSVCLCYSNGVSVSCFKHLNIKEALLLTDVALTLQVGSRNILSIQMKSFGILSKFL